MLDVCCCLFVVVVVARWQVMSYNVEEKIIIIRREKICKKVAKHLVN